MTAPVTLGFPCHGCGLMLRYESAWDTVFAIDLECAKCHAVHMITITRPIKGTYHGSAEPENGGVDAG